MGSGTLRDGPVGGARVGWWGGRIKEATLGFVVVLMVLLHGAGPGLAGLNEGD